MPGLHIAILLSLNELRAAYDCSQLKAFWFEARQEFALLQASAKDIQKTASSIKARAGLITLGIGAVGALIGFPDLLTQVQDLPLNPQIWDTVADASGVIGVVVGGVFTASDFTQKAAGTLAASALRERAETLRKFLADCRKAIELGCPPDVLAEISK